MNTLIKLHPEVVQFLELHCTKEVTECEIKYTMPFGLKIDPESGDGFTYEVVPNGKIPFDGNCPKNKQLIFFDEDGNIFAGELIFDKKIGLVIDTFESSINTKRITHYFDPTIL